MKTCVIIKKVHGALAQLGARHTGSVEVTGSSPVCSTLKSPYLRAFSLFARHGRALTGVSPEHAQIVGNV